MKDLKSKLIKLMVITERSLINKNNNVIVNGLSISKTPTHILESISRKEYLEIIAEYKYVYGGDNKISLRLETLEHSDLIRLNLLEGYQTVYFLGNVFKKHLSKKMPTIDLLQYRVTTEGYFDGRFRTEKDLKDYYSYYNFNKYDVTTLNKHTKSTSWFKEDYPQLGETKYTTVSQTPKYRLSFGSLECFLTEPEYQECITEMKMHKRDEEFISLEIINSLFNKQK